MKQKKTYEQPETTVQRVELESPICSGSANIVNNNEGNMGIESQTTNTDFDAGSQTTGDVNNINGWDYTGN